MSTKTDIWQGTLALMILKTLDTLGPLHGYEIEAIIARFLVPVEDQS